MNDEVQSTPTPLPLPAGPQSMPVEAVFRPRKRGSFSKMVNTLGVAVVLLSIVLNVYLLMFVAMGAAMRDMPDMATDVITEGKEDQTVAVYKLASIIDGEAAEDFQEFYDAVKDDEDVKAVVLRVVSAGGRVSASAEIYRYVCLLKEAGKKVVVSMGSVAASGGYYISAPADLIVAEDSTITGSIGVVMTYFVLEGAMGELGIEPVVIKSTNASAWKDEGSPFRHPSEREQAHLLALLDHYQAQFEEVVIKGRGDRLKPQDELIVETVVEGGEPSVVRMEKTEPLNGKIYAASDALELGLIDEIGFLSDAIDQAAKLADLDEPNVLEYERRRSFMAALFSSRSTSPLEQGRELVNELQTPRFEMIWRVD